MTLDTDTPLERDWELVREVDQGSVSCVGSSASWTTAARSCDGTLTTVSTGRTRLNGGSKRDRERTREQHTVNN